MKQFISYSFCLLFSFSASSQGGYFGKKTVVSVDGSLRATLIYQSMLSNYRYNTGTLTGESSNPVIAGGFTASLSHYFTKNVGIGIDFSMTFNQLKMPYAKQLSYLPDYNQGYYIDYNSTATIEKMNMRTYYIIPKFEWASRGNLPIGICHSIGIGYANSVLTNDNYRILVRNLYDNNGNLIPSMEYKESTSTQRTLHGVVLEYGVKLRLPVTSFMAVNVASNLRFHMPHLQNLTMGGDSEYIDWEEDVRRSMRTSRGSNIMDIRAGLSFILF
ncbi:hypothetical protein H9Y05_09240 [Crocinitomicaceae bacterium CZZ-1]|uniref:Outer membrane protein beta-barrel domain-containing protein n=1 Tax=Taishania pollutisoli TaxID=2766479 RepID=A0A8J6TTC9_9FLAO|nr:hypothetical protein [Taishania pollutisoli]MBC9812654.1 hypothetical protein [Taishania pollutisoli]MBX2949191.1 hypothetical protein [Crocinitomicaceae bacterium]NGF75877.1 hypothetical protein [Fluviicola sp. SGL-29]